MSGNGGAESAGASNEGQVTEGGEHGHGAGPNAVAFPPEMIEALKHKLSSQDNEINQLRQHAGTLERLREAFAPPEQKQKGKWIDPILQHAIEAEKAGRPMPITTEVAVEVQRLNELLEAQEQRNRQMEEQLKRLTDPSAWQDQQMFARMDNMLEETINSLYPEGNNRRQKDAMVASVTEKLKMLQEDPKVWSQFRNNKVAQQKLVHMTAQELVPTTVRKQLAEEYERTSPPTGRELDEAWRAATSAKTAEERHKLTEALRQKMLGMSALRSVKASPRRR